MKCIPFISSQMEEMNTKKIEILLWTYCYTYHFKFPLGYRNQYSIQSKMSSEINKLQFLFEWTTRYQLKVGPGSLKSVLCNPASFSCPPTRLPKVGNYPCVGVKLRNSAVDDVGKSDRLLGPLAWTACYKISPISRTSGD